MVDKLGSLSPSQALKLKHAEHRQARSYAALAQALLREDVSGPDVERLHQTIAFSGGDARVLSTVETELALRRLLTLHARTP